MPNFTMDCGCFRSCSCDDSDRDAAPPLAQGDTYRAWRKQGKNDIHAVVGQATLCTVTGRGLLMGDAEVTCAMCALHIDANHLARAT